jgi:hypothetical protein
MNQQHHRNGQTDLPAFGQIAALGISRKYRNITDEVRMTVCLCNYNCLPLKLVQGSYPDQSICCWNCMTLLVSCSLHHFFILCAVAAKRVVLLTVPQLLTRKSINELTIQFSREKNFWNSWSKLNVTWLWKLRSVFGTVRKNVINWQTHIMRGYWGIFMCWIIFV